MGEMSCCLRARGDTVTSQASLNTSFRVLRVCVYVKRKKGKEKGGKGWEGEGKVKGRGKGREGWGKERGGEKRKEESRTRKGRERRGNGKEGKGREREKRREGLGKGKGRKRREEGEKREERDEEKGGKSLPMHPNPQTITKKQGTYATFPYAPSAHMPPPPSYPHSLSLSSPKPSLTNTQKKNIQSISQSINPSQSNHHPSKCIHSMRTQERPLPLVQRPADRGQSPPRVKVHGVTSVLLGRACVTFFRSSSWPSPFSFLFIFLYFSSFFFGSKFPVVMRWN